MKLSLRFFYFSIIYCLIPCWCSSPIQAQSIVPAEWIELKNLAIQSHLPKYLLSRKSVVLMQVPLSSTQANMRGDWHALAKKVHFALRKSSVDAVGYYYLDDLFSNVDLLATVTQEMLKREIKYILLVEQFGDGVATYRITITSFNKTASFISEGQKAWQDERADLHELLRVLRQAIYRAELTVENYLVPDFPEFFADTKIIQGLRMEFYSKDLKIDPLIVPRFSQYKVEDSTQLDATSLHQIQQYNATVDQKNIRLEEIMTAYPLQYKWANTSSSKEIYNQGHQYLLLNITGSGKSIRQILNYKIDQYATNYISITAAESGSHRIPADRIVTKYYVKHVYTNDVYLGARWDADFTWEKALQNYIFNMKKVLKLKK